MPEGESCSNCGTKDAERRGLCPACTMWERRHDGKQRPEEKIVARNQRRHEGKQR